MTDAYRAVAIAFPTLPAKPTKPAEPMYRASDIRRAAALVAKRTSRHNVQIVHGIGRNLTVQCDSCKSHCEDVDRAAAWLTVGIRHGHSLGVEDERANRYSFSTFNEAVAAIGRNKK